MDELEALKSLYPDRVFVLGSPESAQASSIVARIEVPLLVDDYWFGNDDNKWFTVDAYYSSEESPVADGTDYDWNSVVPQQMRPNFQRTTSGRRWHTMLKVCSLPSVTLSVVFPKTSEQCEPPEFTLASLVLTASELATLCESLDCLANENEGLPVLSLWVDWLSQTALGTIGAEHTYYMTSESDERSTDNRAVPLWQDFNDRIFAIIKSDVEEEQRRFNLSEQECPICLETAVGADMCRLSTCLHHFCRQCLELYVQTKLSDGTVYFLKCPESKCDDAVSPGIIKKLLPNEDFAKWESQTLSRGLEVMGDIDWCPRCKSVVIKDSDHEQSRLAQCTNCFYAFCTQCKDPFHQGRKCISLEEKLHELGVETEEAVESRPSAASLRAKKRLELLNQFTVSKISKPCPGCGANIQKTEGCNKVTCRMCLGYMCWMCGRAIRGYDHFDSTGCSLADDGPYHPQVPPRVVPPRPVHPMEYDVMQNELKQCPELRRKLVKCPVCGQENLKRERNNHIRCWACRRNFCYMCGKQIVGTVTVHFVLPNSAAAAQTCKQHSDD